MKKVLGLVLAGSAMVASMIPSTQAATQTQSVNVTVNLTSVCTIVKSADAIINYTSGVGTTSVTNAAGTVTCTKGVTFTPTWNILTGTRVGILYALAPTGAAATGAGILATGAVQAFTVVPSAGAAQAGDCTAGGTVSVAAPGCSDTTPANTHVLTITY